MPAFHLVGREREIEAVGDLLARVESRGSSLLLRGDPGIGKSALLREAGALARERGLRVLETSGVQAEASLPYAGLHLLLRPLLGLADRLPRPQRLALEGAFGLEDADAPAFIAGLATLTLLGEAAPVVLLVDDAHWLDEASAEVLAFVGRRLESDPIVLLAASRDGTDGPLDRAGLPELRLDPLSHAESTALLDAQAPGLDDRDSLLAAAAGNPLALVELPATWTASRDGGPLPLTKRLEEAFAARASELPDATRALLLVAAVDDGGAVDEVLRAADALADGPEALEPALAAGLVHVERGTIRFRHPLVRSAIQQAAGPVRRRAAHAALADVLDAQPERRLWHRALSSTGPDEQVARGLDEAAATAQRRGAAVVAQDALERAAELSVDPASRGRRLMGAAEIAQELGRTDAMERLIDEAEPLELDAPDRARLAWLREELDSAAWSGAERIRSFVEIAERMSTAGDPDGALNCLLTVALRMWWSNPSQETRDLVVGLVERLPGDELDPRRLAILSYADPVERGAAVIERLSAIRPETVAEAGSLTLLGSAATAVWAPDLSLDFLVPAVDGLRAQGRVGLLAQALTSVTWSARHLGKAELALSAADEGVRLARESGQPRWAAAAQLAQATVLAERGRLADAEQLLLEAEAVLTPAGAGPMLALAQFARGRGALAHQRYDEAIEHLSRIFDPAEVAYHPLLGAWALADLVEAAVHLGRHDDAARWMGELEALVAATPGSLLRAQAGYARPLVAADATAERLYQAGLQTELAGWPSYRGRLLLAYGRWLRRQRRMAESRAPLRAARELFDALGLPTLSDSARRELRASGETSRRRAPDARDQLTPQELQIAQMAAAGLSNKEIGQQLYLSHRTVGSHLYRTFPKLGISSRAELRDVLPAAELA
jgi:DNA-binding CsgD family transcriptional regulator